MRIGAAPLATAAPPAITSASPHPAAAPTSARTAASVVFTAGVGAAPAGVMNEDKARRKIAGGYVRKTTDDGRVREPRRAG